MPRAHAVIARVRRRTFDSFVEHLGRGVYTGLHQPGQPSANEDGFRMDVVELARELGTRTVRCPGGNVVSGFRWEDSAGPRDQRPVRRDLAWHSPESKQGGLDEFARWLKLSGSETMLAVNLGTRGILPPLDLLEYANHPSGTALSDLRVANGTPQPYNVRMRCLGHEMDGPWQTGFMTPDDYGKLAARTAGATKTSNSWSAARPTPGCRPSATGSARCSNTPTATWATRDAPTRRSTSRSTSGTSGTTRSTRSPTRSTTSGGNPPRQLEDVYSVADAVVVGNLLMTLLKHSDRVTSASLAQLVNVIAP